MLDVVALLVLSEVAFKPQDYLAIEDSCHASAGLLILGGNEIPGPYSIRVRRGRLSFNGLAFPVPPESPPVSPTRTQIEKHRLNTRVFQAWQQARDEGIVEPELSARAARIWARSQLVDSCTITRMGTILVWWKSGGPEEMNLGPRQDLRPETPREYWASTISRYCGCLERGGMLIISGRGAVIYVPRVRIPPIAAEIDRLRRPGDSVPGESYLPAVVREQIRSPVRLEHLRD